MEAINLHQADYETVFERDGYIVGFRGSSKYDCTVEALQEKLGIFLLRAPAVCVELRHAPNASKRNLEELADTLELIFPDDIAMIINEEPDEKIFGDNITYTVYLAGLESLQKV